jgi:hypothetical protein
LSTRENLAQYIKNSGSKALNERDEFYTFDDTFVYIKDQLPEDVNIEYVLDTVQASVPSHLTNNVDSIFVGEFDDFIERGTNAFYKDGAIYVSNIQDDNDDMVDDIVHEIAHSVEKSFSMYIYASGNLENEFLGKRRRLYSLLKANDVDLLPEESVFNEPEYSLEFDNYLYQGLGYPMLSNITMGLFNSPYAITSLREYYANGFEEYFLRDKRHLKLVSPVLYNIIEDLENLY